ncbi:hypothetical protein HPP92_019078 [Vanilla planifolia]|uniref:Uncharacterized protein n=1 Tax=Vanilla planifolia TaxID=51239 RepID=A0A835UN01_VANPL|nr:hypothetical protein HPP92_019078 [Vanilla planifolia]
MEVTHHALKLEDGILMSKKWQAKKFFSSSLMGKVVQGEALTIYDNLRVALAKYEALASGTPLPPGSSDCQPTTSSASSPAPSDAYQAQDKEENEDGFSDLAERLFFS